MEKELNKILFNNQQKFVISSGDLDEGANMRHALTLNANLNAYGYCLDQNALNQLSTQTPEQMAQTWNDLIEIVKERTNAKNFSHELFYPNFPEEVMAKSNIELYINSLTQYAALAIDCLAGTDLVSEVRDSIVEEKRERLPLLEDFPKDLKVINLAGEQDINTLMDNRIHSMAINEAQFNEVMTYAKLRPVDFNGIVFSDKKINNKDILCNLAVYYFENRQENQAVALVKDAKDALRIAAKMSNHNLEEKAVAKGKSFIPNKAEISHSTTFKLKGREEFLIYKMLENCKNIYYDIWRSKDDTAIFKRFFNRTDKSKAGERVKGAINNIYTNTKVDEKGKDILSIPRQFEVAIQNKDIERLSYLVENNQGYFVGNLTKMLSLTEDEKFKCVVAEQVKNCVNVEVFQLMKVKNWIEIKNNFEDGTQRYCNAKGKRLAIENKQTLSDNVISVVKENISKALDVATTNTMESEKIYIDPALYGRKVPSRSMKDCSEGAIIMPNSVLENDHNKNILTYMISWKDYKVTKDISWKEHKYTHTLEAGERIRADIDLSAKFFDKDFESVGECYYGNLKTAVAVHSGDYTSAPNGATEAIAVDKALCKEKGIKYVAIDVRGFSVPFSLSENLQFVMEEKEGSLDNLSLKMMGRDSGKVAFNGEVYEPSQASDPIKLNSESTHETILLYNVEDDKTIWLDKDEYSSLLGTNIVGRNSDSVLEAVKFAAENDPIPTMGELFELYAKNNGEIVTDMNDATLVFTAQPIDKAKADLSEETKVISGYELDYISATFCGKPEKLPEPEREIEIEPQDKAPVKEEKKFEQSVATAEYTSMDLMAKIKELEQEVMRLQAKENSSKKKDSNLDR